MADSPFKARTLKRKNVKGLALNAAAAKPPLPSGDGLGGSNPTDMLEIGLEFKLDLRSEDLIPLQEVGAGNGGTVSKVMHASTKVIMARKIIRVDAQENVRKQIVRELQVGHDCNSPYIVTFYGAFQNESRDIVMCMEYMDCPSLDRISKDYGPIRVDVLGKITESILGGLVYLYETHRIMHRDIKPSNVLVNSRGNIKLCDFGVATETVNSIANTFVGTSFYMAPERIQGGAYTVRSDVWSVGLTVMELAIGRFPFTYGDSGDDRAAGPMGILDLLQQIVHEPAPKLPKSDAFPRILEDFVAKCLLKKPEERPTPRQLFDHDAFLQAAKRTPVNIQEWAVSFLDENSRKAALEAAALEAPAPLTISSSRNAHPTSSVKATPPLTGEITVKNQTQSRPRQTPTSRYPEIKRQANIDPLSTFDKLSLNTTPNPPLPMGRNREYYPQSAYPSYTHDPMMHTPAAMAGYHASYIPQNTPMTSRGRVTPEATKLQMKPTQGAAGQGPQVPIGSWRGKY